MDALKNFIHVLFGLLDTPAKKDIANQMIVAAATAKGGPVAGQAAQALLPAIEKLIEDKVNAATAPATSPQV